MDFFNAFLFSFFLLYVFLLLRYLFYKTKSGASTAPLPPGNTGWPFVGETISFLVERWKGHPENFVFDRMNKYSSNIFKSHLIGEKFAVFCGPDAHKFLFSNDSKLVQSWWPDSMNKIFPSSAQTSSTEEAIKMRKMLPNFLKPEALFRYISIMDNVAEKHFATNWENKSQISVFPLTKKFTLWLACRLFISVEDPNHIAKFSDQLDEVGRGFISLPIDFPGTRFNRAIKASEFIRKELADIIRQRKIDLADGISTSTQDILSHMLLTCDENGKFMQEQDIADKILGLLIGGLDNPSSACAFIVNYLAQLPQVYQAVYQEQMNIAKSKAAGELLNWGDIQKMKYSWNVACEVLRLSPPNQVGFREAISDFVYNGFSIPKGWKIFWSANSTHKNPEYFPEPLKFDPSRFEGCGPAPYTFVPFGGGPRMCPGKEFARIEILVFMHHIVKRFKWEKVIPDEKIVFDPMPVPAKGLPVRLYPHKA